MRRLVPSMQVRDELNRLLSSSAGPERNVVSAFVELAIRLVAQQLLEAEQADFLGDHGHLRRCSWAGPGDRGGLPLLGVNPLLVSPPGQHQGQAPR